MRSDDPHPVYSLNSLHHRRHTRSPHALRRGAVPPEIGAALRAGETITIKDLASELGDPPGIPSVNTELKLLEAAGLVERLPKVRSDRRVFLRPVETPYWDTCRWFIQAVLEGSPHQPTRRDAR